MSSSDDVCGICLDSLDDEGTTVRRPGGCVGHEFHRGCLLEWARRMTVCPLCKTDFDEIVGRDGRREKVFDDQCCMICGDVGELVVCDGCDEAAHLACVGLDAVPEGEWHCPTCTGRKESDARWRRQRARQAARDAVVAWCPQQPPTMTHRVPWCPEQPPPTMTHRVAWCPPAEQPMTTQRRRRRPSRPRRIDDDDDDDDIDFAAVASRYLSQRGRPRRRQGGDDPDAVVRRLRDAVTADAARSSRGWPPLHVRAAVAAVNVTAPIANAILKSDLRIDLLRDDAAMALGELLATASAAATDTTLQRRLQARRRDSIHLDDALRPRHRFASLHRLSTDDSSPLSNHQDNPSSRTTNDVVSRRGVTSPPQQKRPRIRRRTTSSHPSNLSPASPGNDVTPPQSTSSDLTVIEPPGGSHVLAALFSQKTSSNR